MVNSRSSTSEDDSEGGDHSPNRPEACIAPTTFGPRASSVAPDRACRNGSATPQLSAASTQPRKPIAVVATMTSGGCAIS